ncbi:M48 family metallopeptidase [Aliikangiella coralliicola]|uniref:M48 family metallopeptidase n=1 Tax=Aliikangiella coralliicola TaxID=2592383 RepID=A0A545U7D0_9GAMM|nr:M48 family metallopeptidase [Aliikangiella coralliicola]TQV85375.1 M48 family metallopeptidase [Aliikangiella coralliicola]
MLKISKKILLGVAITSLITACATNIAGRKQIMLVSENSAIQASKQAYVNTLKPLEQAGKLDSNPQVVRRVNRITDKLIQQAIILRPNTRSWEWSVKVIDDPETVNAWCMAGGKMAIYTGLLNKLSATDDEIAQVMGHEISHALANHSAERMSVAMANNLALNLLKTTTDASAKQMSLATAAAQVALTLPNSRTSESEADKIGIKLAAKAGYNPNAAVTLWQKMAQAGGNQGFEFLSTHPSPENRQQALKAMIPEMMPFYRAAKGK